VAACRRGVGERAGAGLLGEAGQQPQQVREHAADQRNHRPRDAVPGSMRFAHASHFLGEEGEAVGRVLCVKCHWF
jgi:hypothetical protein